MSPDYLNAPDAAPAPTGAKYSHAVKAGPFLYVTGQLPVDPDDVAAPLPAGVEAQTRMVFKNLERIVAHAGYALADSVFARVYLTEFKRDYPGFNRVYQTYFPDDAKLPGRTTVGVTGWPATPWWRSTWCCTGGSVAPAYCGCVVSGRQRTSR